MWKARLYYLSIAFLLIIGIGNIVYTSIYLNNARQANAQVIDIVESADRIRCPKGSFRTDNGRTIETIVSKRLYLGSIGKDQALPVLYDPNKPKSTLIDSF